MSPVNSPWHLASINLAIDRIRDVWNTNRFWSPPFMHLRTLAMSMIVSKPASPREVITLSARFHTQCGFVGSVKELPSPCGW